ncbi:MAG TPA: hypothetical protein VF309_09480 [Usitatibacter sp.]
MTTKQQLATGFLAMVIVGSIAFMPVNAGNKSAPVPAAQAPSGNMVATVTTPELPQEQVKDLTYN